MINSQESEIAIKRARRRGLVVGLAVGALITGAVTVGGVAVASIPSSSGSIDACVNSTGAVRIIDLAKGQKCTSVEKRVTWGKTRYRGTWTSAGSYTGGDIAVRNGSAYQAKTTSKGKDPATQTAYWGLLAARGAIGPVGPKGATGSQGPVGPLPTVLTSSYNTVVTEAFNPGGWVARIDNMPAGTYNVTGRIQAAGLTAPTNVFCQFRLDDQTNENSVDGTLAIFTVPAGAENFVNIPLVSVVQVPTAGSSLKLNCWRSGTEDLGAQVRLNALPIGGVVGNITGA